MLNSCDFQGRFAADPELRTTQSQRQQWQGAADHPGNVQVSQSFSQGSDDDFSVLDDADDLPF